LLGVANTKAKDSEKAKKHAGGRPSAYKVEFAHIAYRHCLLGATDKDLASAFGVHVDTIDEWKRKQPKFSESLKKGKADADATIAESLFHRAKGYSHKAVKIMQHEGIAFDHEYTEHYPPDTAACIFWLKNRRPDQFRNNPEVAVTVNNDVKVDLQKPPEEWGQAEIEAELARRGAPVPGTNGNGNGHSKPRGRA
tara:strand:+ start:197 stop:781 length:585 start_codon:yes stop_codon:yes gene_type:complete